jgi:hypothetical protein
MPIELVKKEYRFDESSFDPPEQDEYRYWLYTFEVSGRTYFVRRYCDEADEAHILSNVRNDDEQALADAGDVARYLVDLEGVRRVNRYNTATGLFNRPVEPA